MSLYASAEVGDLARVMLLVGQGEDINQIGGVWRDTVLGVAARRNHFEVVQYLVEQGAEMDNADSNGWVPLINAAWKGHLDVARYLLERGADRDRSTNYGITPLHVAAANNHMEITKLLMVYGADLNARTDGNSLPIDLAAGEEIKQAIHDEPRRRMDHGYKRATEHINLASAQEQEQQQEGGEDYAEEDDGSETSDDEDDG